MAGSAVSFSALVAGTIVESPADTFFGTGSVPPSEAHGNVNIVFDGPVDSVTLVYKNGPSLNDTPSGIIGAVSDLNWQPPVEVAVALIDGLAANLGVPVSGTYGTFLINVDGSYTYTLDDTHPDVIALGSNETLIDSIPYTLQNTIGQQSTATVFMTIRGINEAPSLALDASSGGTGFSNSLTEGSSPVDVADTDATITDIDILDTVMELMTITPGGISNGASEILTFHGDGGTSILIPLAGSSADQITVGGTVFDVAFNGTALTVTNSVVGGMPNGNLQSLISSITYHNADPKSDRRHPDVRFCGERW